MKDEIKEILKQCSDLLNDDFYMLDTVELTKEELKILLDYITNLQESDNDKQLEIMKLKDKLEQQRKEYQETYKDVRIELKEKDETITNLQEKYDKALEILVEYSMPCERDNFNLLDTDYCELNCSNDEEQYKKCWNEFIEWRLKDE